MNKVLILLLVNCLGFASIAVGQEDTRTYPAKLKNETPSWVEFSNDEKYIGAGVFGAVRVWNLASGEFVDYPTKLKNETPQYVRFTSDGQFIMAGLFGEVRTWKVSP